MSEKKRKVFPLGAIAAITLYIISVYLDIWNRINDLSKILLGIALILLFFADYEEKIRRG